MRLLIFKAIAILGAFMFMQGAVLPWAISNDTLPLWLDIIIISGILAAWVLIVEKGANALISKLEEKDK